MNITDIVIAKKLAGGGGGGGSSDFNTAKVTIIGGGGLIGFTIPVMPIVTPSGIDCGADIYEQEENSKVYDVALYKNSLKIYVPHTDSSSGNISISDGIATITGDCTITVRGDY